MINKRSLWFLTLFSLILVLSIYYITMPSELLLTISDDEDTETVSVTTENEESAELVALRVEAEEQLMNEIAELKEIITDEASTTEEKNAAFEQMQALNENKSNEETIESKIKEEFNLSAVVSIDGTKVSVTVDSTEHDKSVANKIMRLVQEQFDTAMSISVKFQE